ncbi:MAG: ATP-binding protein [Alphaproteobacteria bacterium]|nr:ATP-binding protein [Alphaproteobacteria bacterium]
MTDQPQKITTLLADIATSLAVLSGRSPPPAPTLTKAAAYHWDGARSDLTPVPKVNRVALSLLKGIDGPLDTLLANTNQFAAGHGANNALLWGARGMGKSSLVKAVHAEVTKTATPGAPPLILAEINREDISTLPVLMKAISVLKARVIVFCDDLSFDTGESQYKALKTILDGGLEGRPANALFYATSNRRHLMPRDMIDNERSTAITPHESVDEKISLSDRFGLWLGFHNCDQATYLEMVEAYVHHFSVPVSRDRLRAGAIEWAQTRGARSGRVAIQFVRQLAGQNGLALKEPT